MRVRALSRISDGELLRSLKALVVRDRMTTAELLAHIAEVDARRLYRLAACSSMFVYCLRELRLSEDAAFKRIRAARTARQFPDILDAIAEGRLHLGAVVLLAPHLTANNAGELLVAATHKSKSEIEQLLANRFPKPDLPATLHPIGARPAASSNSCQLAPWSAADPTAVRGQPVFIDTGPVAMSIASGETAAEPAVILAQRVPANELAPGPVAQDPARLNADTPRTRITPLSPQRFGLQVTIGQSAHDKLRHAQTLLSHQVPSGDVAEVIERALDELIAKLEKNKFAATRRPRPSRRCATAGTRYIPVRIRQAVWDRDQGRCTYVSATGQRCDARTFLEFDHVHEVARGGVASLENIRLRCRPHNQLTAEHTFGAGFMDMKRRRLGDER